MPLDLIFLLIEEAMRPPEVTVVEADQDDNSKDFIQILKMLAFLRMVRAASDPHLPPGVASCSPPILALFFDPLHEADPSAQGGEDLQDHRRGDGHQHVPWSVRIAARRLPPPPAAAAIAAAAAAAPPPAAREPRPSPSVAPGKLLFIVLFLGHLFACFAFLSTQAQPPPPPACSGALRLRLRVPARVRALPGDLRLGVSGPDAPMCEFRELDLEPSPVDGNPTYYGCGEMHWPACTLR